MDDVLAREYEVGNPTFEYVKFWRIKWKAIIKIQSIREGFKTTI